MLIEEEYDPVTLEERSEDERLLLEESDSVQAAKMVKNAYSKIVNGYATVREHLKPIGIIVMCVFLAVPILFLSFFIINKWWENGAMMFACIFFSCGSILAAYFICYRGCLAFIIFSRGKSVLSFTEIANILFITEIVKSLFVLKIRRKKDVKVTTAQIV